MLIVEKLLKPSEAAALLGVKVSTLYAWAARRQIPTQRVGRSLRFSPSALSKWLATQARSPRLSRPNFRNSRRG
jgi:excisionase family DNA binding protein